MKSTTCCPAEPWVFARRTSPLTSTGYLLSRDEPPATTIAYPSSVSFVGLQRRSSATAVPRACSEAGTSRARARRRRWTTRCRRQNVLGLRSQLTVTCAPDGCGLTSHCQTVNEGLPSSLPERWAEASRRGVDLLHAGPARPRLAHRVHLHHPLGAGLQHGRSLQDTGHDAVPLAEAVDVGEQRKDGVRLRAHDGRSAGVGGHVSSSPERDATPPSSWVTTARYQTRRPPRRPVIAVLGRDGDTECVAV
jgi:hypothetical protein